MKKILLILIILIPIKINAMESYVVMDPNNNRILASSNMNKEMLIASTTKVMTAIVALENFDTTLVLCAGDEITKVDGSMIYLDKDECMTLYDLLVGLLLRSGNDAAMTIATKTFGYEKFIDKMNEVALRLGMNDTNFENPHGLDYKEKNTSTAHDLALLMSYATKNKTFMEITKIKKYKVTSNKETHLWYNKNQLLTIYKYSTGGKIGYTTKSGHIFVSSATKAKENLVIVTMKDEDQFNNHKKLYEKYFNMYDNYKILDKMTFSINDDYYKNYHLYIKEDLYAMLKDNELNNINLIIDIIKKKNIKSKSVVGVVKLFIGDEYIDEANIHALENNIKKLSLFKLFTN